MKQLHGLIVCLFISLQINAQRNPKIVNSGELIKKGIELHDNDKYAEAIKLYLQVPENDTNYQLACFEAGLSARSNEDYKNSVIYARRGLMDGAGDLDMDLYANIGSALDEDKLYAEAERVFDTIIMKFPNSANGYYNKGTNQTLQGKFAEAEKLLQRAIEINPYSPGAHYAYAYNNYKAGNLVPAYIGFCTFLTLAPNDNRARIAISFLSNMSSQKDTFLALQKKKFTFKDMPDFSEADVIVNSKMAFSSKYKAKSSLDDGIFKQLQAILEVTTSNLDSKDFFTSFYLKLYKRILDKGLFEPMTYKMASGLDIADVNKYVKKNLSEIKDMNSVVYEVLSAVGYQRKVQGWETADKNDNVYHYDDGKLLAKGKFNYASNKKNGVWIFYDRFGRVKEESNYNTAGLADGITKTYYPSGKLQSEITFVAGKVDGPYKAYYENGNINVQTVIKNEKKNGEFKKYFSTGGIKEESNVVNDKLTGPYKEYFNTGVLYFDANYVNDEFDGKVVRFYRNGSKEIEYNFVKGKQEGPFSKYYPDGKIETKGNFKNGKKDGEILNYYPNGQLHSKEQYGNDELEGAVIVYDERGKLKSKNNYSNGKRQDLQSFYNSEEKLWCEEVYNKGHYKSITYFNPSNGAQISKQEVKDKNGNELSIYDRVGIKTQDITCDRDGVYDGKVTSYFENGKVAKVQTFRKGSQEDEEIGYYINGQKSTEVSYIKDKREGAYKGYGKNGKLVSEGNYVADELSGDWYSYEEATGFKDEDDYFVDGESTGISYSYINDRIFKKTIEKDGIIMKQIYFDTLGKVMREVNFFNEKEIAYYNVLNQEMARVQRKNNMDFGTYTFTFPDGSIRVKTTAKGGFYDGLYTSYTPNGTKEYEGNYLNGKSTVSGKPI